MIGSYIESKIIYVTPRKLFLNTSKKITGNGLISPFALYIECSNPVISTPLL